MHCRREAAWQVTVDFWQFHSYTGIAWHGDVKTVLVVPHSIGSLEALSVISIFDPNTSTHAPPNV